MNIRTIQPAKVEKPKTPIMHILGEVFIWTLAVYGMWEIIL